MHELSVAQSIVEFVVEQADENRADRVSEVDVQVGEVMRVDAAVLKKALGALMVGPRLAGARVSVSVERASFSCQKCGSRWDMKDAEKQLSGVSDSLLVREPESNEVPLHFLPGLYTAFLRCPSCGSTDFAATQGEDVRVTKVVLE
ncbi:MAG: hydrogenase/urease maturation nickel metallochaperone HypA [Nitrososphaerales archaeon]